MSYGWIPTSIALPDSTNSDKLLIHTVRGDIVTAYYGGETWTGDAIGEHYHNDEVTHWTFLPDPPKIIPVNVEIKNPGVYHLPDRFKNRYPSEVSARYVFIVCENVPEANRILQEFVDALCLQPVKFFASRVNKEVRLFHDSYRFVVPEQVDILSRGRRPEIVSGVVFERDILKYMKTKEA